MKTASLASFVPSGIQLIPVRYPSDVRHLGRDDDLGARRETRPRDGDGRGPVTCGHSVRGCDSRGREASTLFPKSSRERKRGYEAPPSRVPPPWGWNALGPEQESPPKGLEFTVHGDLGAETTVAQVRPASAE